MIDADDEFDLGDSSLIYLLMLFKSGSQTNQYNPITSGARLARYSPATRPFDRHVA
jgi:hypothetical protein